jgi:hypothetical protein
MPFQIDRTMRGFAVNLGPAMWSARAHMFGGNQMETLELDIVHDLFAQGAASAGDDLNYRLHRAFPINHFGLTSKNTNQIFVKSSQARRLCSIFYHELSGETPDFRATHVLRLVSLIRVNET